MVGAGLFAAGLILDHFLPTLWLGKGVFVLAWLLLGGGIALSAAKNVIKGRVFDENFLMTVATLGAFAIDQFPEAVGVMLFFRLGEFLEHKAVERSRKSILAAVDLRPDTVLLEDGTRIPAEQAKPGDLLLVRPGDRIPLDGTVIRGESRLDTAPITGEPVPVRVAPGSNVFSGSVNLSGQLVLRVEKVLSESLASRILESVESAAASKPRLDRFLTRFARVYTPAVVFAALAVALIPGAITGDWHYWVYTALSFLVMSCPCALVLSVPLAFFSGIGAASKKGILFKGGSSLEALAQVRAAALDKTGTLTMGDFSVQSVDGGDEILALCAGCEAHSSHPIAVSITAAAKEKSLSLPCTEELEEIPGHGIRARVAGKQVLCGNEKLLSRFGIAVPDEKTTGTRVLVAVDGTLSGSILISDTVKPQAAQAVAELKSLGITPVMLTGDEKTTAEAVAKELGISRVYARLLPQEKLEVLQALRQEKGGVLFVGDGINDAPVLSGADVGAAMGSGADAAIEAADVVFLTNRAAAIPEAVRLARATMGIARQNVVLALGIKLAVMVLGLFGAASLWAAVFADSGVALLCVLNAIRLLYKKSAAEKPTPAAE